MTLEGWIEAATEGLPAEVVSRVAAEARAHTQDAVEAGVTEAQAVSALGDPQQVHRALRRTYLPEERLRQLREGPARFVSYVTWGLPVWYVLAAVIGGVLAPPFDGSRLIAPAVMLLLVTLLWWWTSHFVPERKSLWRTNGAIGSVQSIQVLSWLVGSQYGDPVVWPWLIPLIGALLLLMLGWTLLEDARLRRTLALRGRRA